MSSVYEEFARELDTWRRRYAGHPEQEMLRLLFLALEREEVVSVSYRETLMRHRLQQMPILPSAQNLIHHALVWTWKDEQMHTLYLRGAILRMGSLLLRIRAFGKQMTGAIGGWAGSVRQHIPMSQAPFSFLLATGITALGSLGGQIPHDVQEYLRYRPFRDFCLFNIDAEKTAALCYERMLALIPHLPSVPPALEDDLRRVWEDEERHTRIFEIIAAALDTKDSLVEGETLETLAAKIGAVGEYFLPRALRSAATTSSPSGLPAQVWIRQGAAAADKIPTFCRLLDEASLRAQLEARAHALGKPLHALKVVIKVAFMLGYDRRDRSIITDPELIDTLALQLQELGCTDITVVEARNLYDHFYANRTVAAVAAYFGIASSAFQVADMSEDQVTHAYFRGFAQYTVSRRWKEADFRIDFGKMRSHATEQVYLTVGNLESVGTRSDEFIFAERQAHRDTAVMMLMSEFPAHFALLDGYDSAADGLVGMMGCPRPQTPHRLYAATDALALDMVAARHLGLSDPRRSILLNTACQWFGDPTAETEVIGENTPLVGWRSPCHNEWTTLLSLLAYPMYEFASGRGALFVPEMDTQAFPPLARESLYLRAGRRVMQTLLGLRHQRRHKK